MRLAVLLIALAAPVSAQMRAVEGRVAAPSGPAAGVPLARPAAGLSAAALPAPLLAPAAPLAAFSAPAPVAAPTAASFARSAAPAARALSAGARSFQSAKNDGERTAALDALFLGAAASEGRDPDAVPVTMNPRNGWGELARRHIPGVMKMVGAAGGALDAQARLDSSPLGVRVWSGLRAAFYTLPVVLLGLLGATLASSPWGLVMRGLHIGQTAEGQELLRRAWFPLVSGVLARNIGVQLVLLGGVFSGLKALLPRAGLTAERVTLYAGAAAVAASLPVFLALHFPLMAAVPLMGAEAALVWAYARSKSLLVPLAANAMLNVTSLYSARMSAWLRAPVTGSLDSLPGIPGFAGVMAVLGLTAVLFVGSAAARFHATRGWGFLKAAAAREWSRLAAFGRWWDAPRADGAAKSLLPVLSLGGVWGVGIYLSTYLAYWGAAALSPTQEIIPDVLKKSLLMPFDSLVFVFLVGAALEEWMFRRGLFEKLRARFSGRLGSFAVPAAAVLSAVVFSLFHYIDWRVVLDALHVHLSAETRALMGVYSFSWAGCLGRVSAGVLLAALYRRSRSMTLSLTAHFSSNLLEAVGLHWGLPWFLTGVTGLFAFRWLQAARRRSA